MLPPRDPPQNKRFPQAESGGLENSIPCKWNKRKAGVAVLILDRIDFKTKAITGDKEGHYIILKGSI